MIALWYQKEIRPEEHGMERKKASDYPQELLNLFDRYVHGEIDRRGFLDGAKKFAVGGVTATAIWESLRPNYAWAQQVPKDDSRHQDGVRDRAVAAGQRQHQGLPGAAGEGAGQAAGRAGGPREPRAEPVYRRRGAAAGHGEFHRVRARRADERRRLSGRRREGRAAVRQGRPAEDDEDSWRRRAG